MGNLNRILDVWVVHRSKRKGSKPKLELFTDTTVDEIINSNKRIPIIPNDNDILDVGVGKSFESYFKKKYKL
jgi:hypothetical protein